MATKNKELEMFTFDQIKDEFIGEIGTEKRMQYEQELQLEIMGEMIRKVRHDELAVEGNNSNQVSILRRWQNLKNSNH